MEKPQTHTEIDSITKRIERLRAEAAKTKKRKVNPMSYFAKSKKK
jgi:hypothetical protein